LNGDDYVADSISFSSIPFVSVAVITATTTIIPPLPRPMLLLAAIVSHSPLQSSFRPHS
jgi:hypothetical protein